MNTEWKDMIGRRFQIENKSLVNGSAEDLVEFYMESRLVQPHVDRWKRWKDQLKDRQVQPGKSEIRVKPMDARPVSGQDLLVKLRVHQSLLYHQKGELFKEERIELKRLILRDTHNGWKIFSEEATREGSVFDQKEMPIWMDRYHAYQESRRVPSAPLLNRHLLSGGGYRATYDRNQATRYADAWWDDYNPDYRQFSVDCTNYVSQCMYAGGAPMNYSGSRDRGWWYKGNGDQTDQWSYSWAVAHSLRWYLPTSREGLRATEVSSASELTLGDVICYDFDGDGKWQHNTIVTARDASGEPLVNAHTVNSYHRYWDYRDSYAYSPKTKYKFYRIADEF